VEFENFKVTKLLNKIVKYYVFIFFFENAKFSNFPSFFLSFHLHLYYLLFANVFGFQTFPNLAFQAPSIICTWQEGGWGNTTPNKQAITSQGEERTIVMQGRE